jgi:dTDP-4-dehydrorhamnose 3,5-epimerase
VKAREFAVLGARELAPQLHADSRGMFSEWFTDASFSAFAGHRLDLHLATAL